MIDYNALIWPLTFMLVSLLLLRQLRMDLNPIFRSVIGGVSQNAQRNSMAYAMCFLMACAASLQALADVSRDLGWVYVEAACKVIQPGTVAIIAYVTKSPSLPSETPTPPPK